MDLFSCIHLHTLGGARSHHREGVDGSNPEDLLHSQDAANTSACVQFRTITFCMKCACLVLSEYLLLGLNIVAGLYHTQIFGQLQLQNKFSLLRCCERG